MKWRSCSIIEDRCRLTNAIKWALMMRIISDEKGGHWGWCSGPLLQILCYAVLMMWSATGWLGSYSSPSDIQRLFTIPPKPIASANEEVALSFGMHGANAKLIDPSHDRSPSSAVALRLCTPVPTYCRASELPLPRTEYKGGGVFGLVIFSNSRATRDD